MAGQEKGQNRLNLIKDPAAGPDPSIFSAVVLVDQYGLPSRVLRVLRMSLRCIAFSLRLRMVEGFSKYSLFFHSRMIPSFSTMRLKRFRAFSRGSFSSIVIWLMENHLPSIAAVIVRIHGILSSPARTSGSQATPEIRSSQCK